MLDFRAILLALTIFINIGTIFFIYFRRKTSVTSTLFILFNFSIVLWGMAWFFYFIGDNTVSLFSLKASYAAALCIAVSFYFFSFVFPEERLPSKPHQIVVLTISFFAAIFFLLPGTLVESTQYSTSTITAKLITLHFLVFAVIFATFYLVSMTRLWKKFLWGKFDPQIKRQLLAIVLSASVVGLLGIYFDLYLGSPYLKDFSYLWTGPLFTTFIAITVIYAAFSLNLFNSKTIASQLFIFLLWLFTFTRMLLAGDSTERILNSLLFVFSIILGILLIRSVQSEVDAREQIESLAEQLEKANGALKKLDQLKDEFLSIASHQLRAPLTAIRGYASLITDGDYGEVPEKIKDPLGRISESSRNMANSIEDYLNISRIEQGRMKYEKSTFDMADLCKKTVEELRPVADRRGLALTCNASEAVTVSADVGKVKQVISNLIDNAIKYTEKGGVSVSVKKEGDKARFMVEDSGMGLSREDIEGLFEKFKRARGANQVNTTGTGLGLYVAKQLIEGHGGKVWAESDGKGKGSRFIFELPA